MNTYDANFFTTLIDQLLHISAHSKSIPAQMCGEAAVALQKILDQDAAQKKIQELTALVESMRREKAVSKDTPEWRTIAAVKERSPYSMEPFFNPKTGSIDFRRSQ